MPPLVANGPHLAAEDGLAVQARGLTKRYGSLVAVDGVDLAVAAGTVYGYLGPNGAGKTTTLRMLFGLVHPDAGSIRLFGRDPFADAVSALRGVAGFVETPRFYPYLSGRRNLEWCAALDGDEARERIEEALAVVELGERAGDRVGVYSFGMLQRLGIAAALLRSPRLLVFDEPTAGLDPAGQRAMHALIRRLASEGITVLLSSHLLAEVEELCDRVAITRRGRIVHEAAIDDLRRTTTGRYRLWTSDDARALALCRGSAGLFDVDLRAGELVFRAEEGAVESLGVELVRAGIAIRALIPDTVTLEGLFFESTEPSGGSAPGSRPS